MDWGGRLRRHGRSIDDGVVWKKDIRGKVVEGQEGVDGDNIVVAQG